MDKETGKEIRKSMEYLIRLLHKEWERSGRTKAEISMNAAEAEAAGMKLAEEITARQAQLEVQGMSFEECMELSRENFILLRLARKVKEACSGTGHPEKDRPAAVEVDQEECRLFSLLFKTQEVG